MNALSFVCLFVCGVSLIVATLYDIRDRLPNKKKRKFEKFTRKVPKDDAPDPKEVAAEIERVKWRKEFCDNLSKARCRAALNALHRVDPENYPEHFDGEGNEIK